MWDICSVRFLIKVGQSANASVVGEMCQVHCLYPAILSTFVLIIYYRFCSCLADRVEILTHNLKKRKQ